MFHWIVSGGYRGEILGNSPLHWALSLSIFVCSFLLLLVLRQYISRKIARKDESRAHDWRNLCSSLVADTSKILLIVTSGCFAANFVDLPLQVWHWIRGGMIFFLFYQSGLWANELINFWIGKNLQRRTETDPSSTAAYGIIAFFLRIALWSVLTLLVLENFGVDVTALVAGLGVGSVAIALALQNLLGDIFCSVSIVLDKPFEIGDFIVVDTFAGEVERIGIKSTRIRSLQGEQIVISNANLIASRIQNFKRMAERRVLFRLGVTYQTPAEKVREIPEILRAIIEHTPRTRFDRAHFVSFGDSALQFEIVFYVLTREYNPYMDIQQSINLAIMDEFTKRGIEFAYPTQTIFVEGVTFPSASEVRRRA